MKIRIDFYLILGQTIESIPEPVMKEGTELPPPPELPEGAPREVIRIPHSAVLVREEDCWSGVFIHPHWGEVPASDISVSGNHIAFTAPSGKDDKGGQPVLFNFSFVRVDSTDQVVGFSGGQAPYFRSFLPVEGTVSVLEDKRTDGNTL